MLSVLASNFLIISFLVLLVLFAWPSIRILHRAGYSGWWVLLGVVPLVNLICCYIFAFARWPSLEGGAPRERSLRREWPSPANRPR